LRNRDSRLRQQKWQSRNASFRTGNRDGYGEIVTLSREHDGERFHGAVVGLGGLGVVTRLTLDVQPAFDMRQVVYENDSRCSRWRRSRQMPFQVSERQVFINNLPHVECRLNVER